MDNKLEKFISGAIGGAFDSAMSIFPGVSIVWGAIKGGVGNIREKRALEFILFLQKNINVSNFENEQFIDGLGLTFEQYLKQRNETKRKIIQNIFLGYVFSDNKVDFELERMHDVLNKITEYQIYLLKKIKLENEKIKNKLGEPIGTVKLMENGQYKEDYDEYKYLEFLGLISVISEKEIYKDEDYSELEETEKAILTNSGEDFIKFIIK